MWRGAPVLTRSVVVVASVLLPLAVLANRTSYVDVPLADVVRRADAVLLVRNAEPASSEKIHDITPKGKKKDAKLYPPFKRTRSHVVVVEQWKGQTDLLGQALVVDGADWEWMLEIHRKYHVEKVSKSPQVERYIPQGKGGGAESILFVRKTAAGWSLVVQGARESKDQADAVRALLPANDAEERGSHGE